MKVTWQTAKYDDPYSEFVLCILPIQVHTHTQQWTHTHREHTPGPVGSHLFCGARGAVGGSVPCSRAPRCDIEGVESTVHSLPSPTTPAGPRFELATFRLWVWLSNIRPRFPEDYILVWCYWYGFFSRHVIGCSLLMSHFLMHALH